MKSWSHTRPWLFACWLWALLFACDFAVAQPPDRRLEKIFADWQKRQQRIQTVRYRVRGEHVQMKGTDTDEHDRPLRPASPPRDVSGELKWIMLFDFETDRYRREVSEQVYDRITGGFDTSEGLDVFNGSVVKGFTPRTTNIGPIFNPPGSRPDLVVVSGNLRAAAFHSEYLPLFFGHGVVRTIMDEVVPGHFRKQPDIDYFRVHGSAAVAGRPCIVLRTQTLKLSSTSFDEFWVDTARDSAIVRYVEYSADKPFNEIVLQYESTPYGWLPQRWTFTHFTAGHTHFLERMRVEERAVGVPVTDSDFDIETRPGMRVEEHHFGSTPNPLAQPEGQTTTYEVAEGINVLMPKSWPAWVWWTAGLLAALTLFGWLIKRRWRAPAEGR